MSSTRRKFVLSAAAAALGGVALTGCSRSSMPEAPRPVVKKILVLPVLPPDRFWTYNNLIRGVIASAIANRIKSNIFDEKMASERNAMGPKLTAALVEQLRRQGYDAEVLDWPDRKDPYAVDIDKLPGTAPVLHVYFGEAGMDSAKFSRYYQPRVNISVDLVGRGTVGSLYGESIYYGADARGEASWSVPAPERFRFPDFESLVDRPAEVVASIDAGIQGLAQQVARNIKDQT
ncbi:hypothetical protein [Variovorax sp. dw_308]|uniref:hypothetical protein n=1 Tax=Variovorax sp. dw_308 TaxID=2721546 RepID=UPI001C43E7E2|nr:hypothetical protein [Variovorax sp. dw_308]